MIAAYGDSSGDAEMLAAAERGEMKAFSAGPRASLDRSMPWATESSLSWFFWIDDDATAEFAHQTRFVILDANDASGNDLHGCA